MLLFNETTLKGAYLISPEKFEDDRGFFARSFSRTEFLGHGLQTRFAETGIAFNRRRHTVRGMHFQKPPHTQAKLVHCVRGALYDVMIDLRPQSETYKQWFAHVLTARNIHPRRVCPWIRNPRRRDGDRLSAVGRVCACERRRHQMG